MGCQHVVAVCCLLMLAGRSAAEPATFVTETLFSTRMQSTNVKIAAVEQSADNSDGGYRPVELPCLEQSSMKNCRYTGCPVSQTCDTTGCSCLLPDSVVFQTDFACCFDKHSMAADVGSVGFSYTEPAVTCDWEISMYRWASQDNWTPYMMASRTALKFGTVLGTCYLNTEANKCKPPLLPGHGTQAGSKTVVMSIQGGLYVSCAYSTEATPVTAPALETCAAGGTPDIQGRQVGVRGTASNRTVSASDLRAGVQQTTPPVGGDFWNVILELAGEAPNCAAGLTGRRRLAQDYGFAHTTGFSDASVAVDLEDAEDDVTYYAGKAVVISGPVQLVSPGNNVKELGMLQFTPLFVGSDDPVTALSPHWPLVYGRKMQVQFTHSLPSY